MESGILELSVIFRNDPEEDRITVMYDMITVADAVSVMQSLVMFNEGIPSDSLEMLRFDSIDDSNC